MLAFYRCVGKQIFRSHELFRFSVQECACHEDSYRNTGVGSSTSCPEYTLRMPYQCSGSERSCDYTVKWEDARRNVNVTLSARIGSQGGWSAIGFTASRGVSPKTLATGLFGGVMFDPSGLASVHVCYRRNLVPTFHAVKWRA